ncbi:MAG TPA: hypothetical protein DEF51_35965 [Myxococcales bacterium]|nr:hypothetical protein [Myxococcales bacterium]
MRTAVGRVWLDHLPSRSRFGDRAEVDAQLLALVPGSALRTFGIVRKLAMPRTRSAQAALRLGFEPTTRMLS